MHYLRENVSRNVGEVCSEIHAYASFHAGLFFLMNAQINPEREQNGFNGKTLKSSMDWKDPVLPTSNSDCVYQYK